MILLDRMYAIKLVSLSPLILFSLVLLFVNSEVREKKDGVVRGSNKAMEEANTPEPSISVREKKSQIWYTHSWMSGSFSPPLGALLVSGTRGSW